MKLKLTMILMSAFIMANAFSAEKITLVKVREIGVMKNKIIFQSKNVKKIKGTNAVKGKLIAQWGLNVYEVVNGIYACNSKNICRLSEYERVATYEKCTVKKQKASCSGKISGDDRSISEDRDVIVFPDGMDDGSHRDDPRDSIDEPGDEFGSSINAEADII